MKSLFVVAMGFGLYVFGATFGGKIEGSLAPVVTRADISRMKPVGPVATRIWGRFDKLRDCPFESLAFYLGDTESSSRADMLFEEVASVRRTGDENFGPWLVQLTPDQLNGRSFAVVKHQCHPLWLTETVFY